MHLQTDLGEESKLPSTAAETGYVGLSADSPDLGDGARGARLERIDYSAIDPSTYRSIRRVLDPAFDDTDDSADSLQDLSDFDHWFVAANRRVVGRLQLRPQVRVWNGVPPSENGNYLGVEEASVADRV